ncbi:unnamed protein product, partial [Phaeothamnion confervicola]
GARAAAAAGGAVTPQRYLVRIADAPCSLFRRAARLAYMTCHTGAVSSGRTTVSISEPLPWGPGLQVAFGKLRYAEYKCNTETALFRDRGAFQRWEAAVEMRAAMEAVCSVHLRQERRLFREARAAVKDASDDGDDSGSDVAGGGEPKKDKGNAAFAGGNSKKGSDAVVEAAMEDAVINEALASLPAHVAQFAELEGESGSFGGAGAVGGTASGAPAAATGSNPKTANDSVLAGDAAAAVIAILGACSRCLQDHQRLLSLAALAVENTEVSSREFKNLDAATLPLPPLPEFLLQLDAGWVLASAVWEGVAVLERAREYDAALPLLMQLLQTRYTPHRRGRLWNRLALDMQHLGRHGEAFTACRTALQDPYVVGGDRLTLEKRLQRLAKCDDHGEKVGSGGCSSRSGGCGGGAGLNGDAGSGKSDGGGDRGTGGSTSGTESTATAIASDDDDDFELPASRKRRRDSEKGKRPKKRNPIAVSTGEEIGERCTVDQHGANCVAGRLL